MNEEIITGLKNAVENGENLHEAMQIMINSGYNLKEVQEASRFIGASILENNEVKPEEQLVFPERNSSFSKLAFWEKNKTDNPPQSKNQEISQIKGAISSFDSQSSVNTMSDINQIQGRLSRELQNIKPKTSYKKEILLLITLLILIGILISTILLKNTILGWFS